MAVTANRVFTETITLRLTPEQVSILDLAAEDMRVETRKNANPQTVIRSLIDTLGKKQARGKKAKAE